MATSKDETSDLFLIFGLRRIEGESNAFVVVDALQRQHHVWDDISLGKLLAKLHDDPEIPRAKVDRPQNDAIGFVARIARQILPEYADLLSHAEPLAHHAAEKLKSRAKTNGHRSSKGPRPAKRRSVKDKEA
jgi:hypothetical protein